VRFDDMLATLLAQPHQGEDACIALWWQLVDLLAQGRFTEDEALGRRAIEKIAYLRTRVPAAVKARAARAFSGRSVSKGAVALFADEPAPVVAPIIAAADLTPAEWLELLPSLGPTSRHLLRHRRDLSPAVLRGLESFGSTDFVLAGNGQPAVAEEAGRESDAVSRQPRQGLVRTADMKLSPSAMTKALAGQHGEHGSAQAETERSESQIRDLITRIAAYQSRDAQAATEEGEQATVTVGTSPPAAIAPTIVLPESAEEGCFRFETGPDGAISWVDGVPRGLLLGEMIAVAGYRGDHGVDNYVAGAFRQRAPFRDARLTLPDGPLAGEWRISGVPAFDAVDGRFSGYRCTARRPRPEEVAPRTTGYGIFGDADASDSMRQLVHELRTPLNAIIGFSEMIEGQFLGPAGSKYREKAHEIVVQGQRLLAALEDLDLTARFDSRRSNQWAIDPVELIERLDREYQPVADERGFQVNFRIASDIGLVTADPVAVERMFGRLLSATLAVAQPGEVIEVELVHDPDSRARMNLTIARPAMLEGRDERTLLDPGYSPDGQLLDTPVLGLGFALRLVRNIAVACGGGLEIQPDRILLRLPLKRMSARTRRG